MTKKEHIEKFLDKWDNPKRLPSVKKELIDNLHDLLENIMPDEGIMYVTKKYILDQLNEVKSEMK